MPIGSNATSPAWPRTRRSPARTCARTPRRIAARRSRAGRSRRARSGSRARSSARRMGWAARREASHKAMAPLMETRTLLEGAGLPVEIVAGGSTGTHDIDVELGGLTELQSGSYCVMDVDYRRIGGRDAEMLTSFEMALTVATTVVSVPTADRAMVDGGLKAFSTDKPFPPVSVERPGITYEFAGDEHGRLIITDPSRVPRLR